MFNNRQSRRRFRLGNLARLVQLRQSVSHLPPLKTLQETSSQSPPQSPPFQPSQSPSFQPPPTQLPSSIPSPSTLPRVPPKSNSSPPSPPMSKPVEIHRSLIVRSPPQSLLESSESHPQPLTSVHPPSPLPSTLNATKESPDSPPLMAVKPIDETQFRSPLPLRVQPPSLSEFDGSQLLLPPYKVPISSPSTPTLNFQSQTSSPLSPAKTIDESQFQSLPPSLSESSESQSSFQLPEAKIPPSPPSTLKVPEEPQSQPPPPLPPSKSVNETQFQSSSSSPTSIPPPEANVTSYLLPKLNSSEDFQPQPPPPLLPSESIHRARFRSSPPPSEILPQSLLESRESQPSLSPTEAKIPPSPPSALITTEKSLPQTPPRLLPSKYIDRTELPSSPPPLKISPQSLSESGECQPSLPPTESKSPISLQSTLNATGKSKHQPPPSLAPSKPIDVIRFRSSPLSQASPLSVSKSGKSQPLPPPPEAKISPSPPLTLNAAKESQPQPPPPLMPPKFIDETRSQSPLISLPPLSKSTEEPKSTPALPESDQQSISQTHSSPLLSRKNSEKSQSPMPPPPSPMKSLLMKAPIPSPSYFKAKITTPPPPPLKSKITTSPEPSLPQMNPNPIESFSEKVRNTESHTSPDHNKDQNHNSEKPDHELMKISKTGITGKVNKNRGRTVWSEKIPEPMIMMFINSNVQGINMSLSLDSSFIDHEPGVHLTIDYDQSCEFSSEVF